MLSYRDAVDQLYSVTLSLFTARSDAASRIARRTAAGKWGQTEADSPAPPLIPIGDGGGASSETALVARRLADAEAAFRSRVEALLGDLAYCPDADMRFLGVVMNFNDAYRVVRRRRTGGHHHHHGDKERYRAAREGTVTAEGTETPAARS